MYVYYLDKLTAKITGYTECSKYTIAENIDFSEKSKVIVPDRPDITDDDIVVIRDAYSQVFAGICSEVSVGKAPYTLTLLPLEKIFDRKIFIGNEALISSTGLEDFVADEIRRNFINSGDPIFDKPYMTVKASTHTPRSLTIPSVVDSENGIYNLKTFLGNIKEFYQIMLKFEITNESVGIEVYRDTTEALELDTQYSDISNLEETYKVDVLAKLNVKWVIPQQDKDGNEIDPVIQFLTFYLLKDRTVTMDATDPNRVEGTIDTICVQTEDEDELVEQVSNSFISNSYSHCMTFDISKTSQIYPPELFYIGRKVSIKSKRTGETTSSVITKISGSSDNAMRSITIGKLPITLIEKIRRL